LARMNYDPWGNLWWPRKQAYHTPPCQKNKLANFLDRFRGHILGKSQHDPWRLGYHYAKVLTPYLFTGRKLDASTGQYFNRWRNYAPKYGRFTSSDPMSFDAGNNLYAYANLNPLRYTDPWGLEPWSTGKYKWDYNTWFHHPSTTDRERVCSDYIADETADWYLTYIGSKAFSKLGKSISKWWSADKVAPLGQGGKPLKITISQLEKKFKHAVDFGVNEGRSKVGFEQFGRAIQDFVKQGSNKVINGTFRGQPATFHVDPQTGLSVIKDASGKFLSAWKLNVDQLRNVLTRGKLL